MTDLLHASRRMALTASRVKDLLVDALRKIAEDLQLFGRGLDGSGYGTVLWNEDTSTWSLTVDQSATNESVDISGVGGSVDDRMIDGQGKLVAFGALGTIEVLITNNQDYVLMGKAESVPAISGGVVESLNLPGTYVYEKTQEVAGLKAGAGAVTDLGGSSLKVLVDNVLDPSEGDQSNLTDHLVRVYLTPLEEGGTVGPQGLTGWYEDLAIQWDGVNNHVNTTTYLGQSTPSTTSLDYTIVLLGPIIRRTGNEPAGAAPFGYYQGKGAAAVVNNVYDWRTAVGQSLAIRCAPSRGGTHFNDLSVAGVLSGDLDVTGKIQTLRNVAGGDYAEVGGLLANEDDSGIFGASSTAEVESPNYYDLPANTLTDKAIVRVRALCNLNYNSGVPTFRLRMGAVATAVASRNLLHEHVVASPVDQDHVLMTAEFRVVTPGATLALFGYGQSWSDQAADTMQIMKRSNVDIGGGDGTAIIRISPTVQSDTSHAANSASVRYFTVEVVGGG